MTFKEEQEILKEIVEKDGRLDLDKIIQLPVKTKGYVYYANPIKIMKDEFLGETSYKIERPEGCKMMFCDACENCELKKEHCVDANLPDRFWVHEDSPYLSMVINAYGNGVFDNEADCVKWCSEHNDTEIWENIYSKIKDYLQ